MAKGAYLVGIAGGSGSGKTTVLRALEEQLPPGSICRLSQDDYYLPLDRQTIDPQGEVNFDLPSGVDMDRLTEDLKGLLAGVPVHRQEYTFNVLDGPARWITVRPAPIIIVEGLFVLHHQPLCNLLDLKVFIDVSEEVQLARRLARDEAHRGYGRDAVLYQWEHHVLPAFREYLLPYRAQCDLHLENETCYRPGLTHLVDRLRGVVPADGPFQTV